MHVTPPIYDRSVPQRLCRRYRGLLRPADTAWHRWLKFGRPRKWDRERVLFISRRSDILAIYLILLILACAVAPVLLISAAARRPFTFRAFVLTASVFLGLGALATSPLWTGTLSGEAREVWRDRATLIYLVLGTWIAFAYQKRSSDLAAVREVYHQWLDVQSRAIQAAVMLSGPAGCVAQLVEWRERRPDLVDGISQRLLAGARDAQVAIQDTAHRMIAIGRRSSSLRLFAVNEAALHASQLLNAKLDLLADWQQEVVGIPSTMPSSPDALKRILRDIQQACEKATQGLEIWLRT